MDDLCYRLQYYNRTSSVAPRFHLKSTVVEAFIAWKLYRMEHNYNEWLYFSFTGDMGAYHTKRIKRFVEAIPEIFGEYIDLTDSEGIIHYKNPEGKVFICEPCGVFTFKRGSHPHGAICDDILRDAQVRLDIVQIEKITRIFFEEIEQMPKETLHLVGTPQDQEDLFGQLDSRAEYNSKRYDCYIDEEKHICWWEQKFNWDELERRKSTIGEKAFLKEFRCRPVRGAEGFISLTQIGKMLNSRLRNYELARPPKIKDKTIVAGFDIGKKTHPSHLGVFAVVRCLFLTPENNMIFRDKMVQIHSKFMDGWDYTDQIDYLKQAVDIFGIDKMFYDNTRSEFEECSERGDLPSCMEGVPFTAKSKFKWATELDRSLGTTKNKSSCLIQILDDDRQKRQILTVDCDLKAPETSEGHGDSFFSLCLAVQAWNDTKGEIAWLA